MNSDVQKFLEKRKKVILKKWFDLVVDTYHPDTSTFLRKEKDPFNNPVGRTTLTSLETLLDYLQDKSNEDALVSALDAVIRIRSIQDFSPSRAIGFIFFLKKIIRDEAARETKTEGFTQSLFTIEYRIDGLMMMAFDIYAKCKETLYQIKANEEKNRFYKAFERAGLITEITE